MKESIKRIGKEIEEVIKQGEKAEKEVNKKIDEIKIEIETRRVELLEEIEKKREEKIKRLRNQKDELEMNQVGLETCLIFGNNLINLGNGIEISLSKDYFLKRITNLKNEKIQFESCSRPFIIFESTSSLSQLLNAISSFGSIIDQSISNENTFAIINGVEIHEKPTAPILVESGTPFKFEMISVDQFGSKMEKGGAIFDYSFEPPFPDAQVNFSFLFSSFLSLSIKQQNDNVFFIH